jgi:hypothetical protein
MSACFTSIRDDPYRTSRKNSLELIELSSVNEDNAIKVTQLSFSFLIILKYSVVQVDEMKSSGPRRVGRPASTSTPTGLYRI